MKKPSFFGYKITAVALALLLWLYVGQTQNSTTEKIFTIPLEISNLSSDLVVREQDYQIQVRVEGAKQVINSTLTQDISAYVDVGDVGVGTATKSVKVTLPSKLQLISVDPSTVSLTVEELQTRQFKLNVDSTSLDVAAGYLAADSIISPGEIVISGASGYLDEIAEVFVSAQAEDLSESYSQSLPIQVKNKNGELITQWLDIEPSFANVFIPVIGQQTEKTLPIDVPVVGTVTSGYVLNRIVVNPATVAIYADQSKLNTMYYIQTNPVDISDLKKSFNTVLYLALDEGVSTTLAESKVTVYFDIEPIVQKPFSKLLIHAQNVNQDYEVSLSQPSLSLTISGPKSLIENYLESNVIATIDCSGLTGGTYDLPIYVNLPSSITIVEMTLQEVEVTVKKIND